MSLLQSASSVTPAELTALETRPLSETGGHNTSSFFIFQSVSVQNDFIVSLVSNVTFIYVTVVLFQAA